MPHTITPDVDRLPWLTDTHIKRRRRPNHFVVTFLAASAVTIVAALSFWLGMSGSLRPQRAETSLDLPPAQPATAEIVKPAPAMPQVEPVALPSQVTLPVQKEVRFEVRPERSPKAKAKGRVRASRPVMANASESQAEESSRSDGLRYTNPWKSAGVSGRMVRVGAYSSLEKGKEAWSRLAKLSPAISQLPAVVTDLPSKNGRVYYWLQIGTTSQAHSEVLCQRMRAIRQSCVVVDLAGARNERQSVDL